MTTQGSCLSTLKRKMKGHSQVPDVDIVNVMNVVFQS